MSFAVDHEGASRGDVAELMATVGGDDRDWADGRSDFDVPHRLAVGAELRLPILAGVSIAGVYRYQSGYPFTPGFRDGVDMNGDGSGRNDPAFVDNAIPGTDELVRQ